MTAIPAPISTLPRSKPDLRLTLQAFGREILAAFASAQSGTIQAFYPGPPQTADVALNASIVVSYQQTPGGPLLPITKPYPLLAVVPVIFLGGGGAALTFPVKAGDSCLLVFLDRDNDTWLTTGQTGQPPNTARLHNLSDAVAIVGLRPGPGGLNPFSTTDVQLYGAAGAGGPLISLAPGTDGQIGIGNATGQLVAQLDALAAALDQLATALTSGWTDSAGKTPSTATTTAINNAKANWDAAKTAWDAILK